jgi:hypothetical protein
MIIIYLSFFFSGHMCSGAIEIKDNQITYWNDGNYVTEVITQKNESGSDTIIKTETGRIIVIGKTKVQYFLGNKFVTLHVKQEMQWKKKL